MKGEIVKMKNTDSSISNSINGIVHSRKLSYIIWQILSSEAARYFYSISIISIFGFILFHLQTHISYQAVSLVFLFVISLLPLLNFKPGPIFLAAITSSFIWNYFFIPPAFTLRIGKVEDVLMYVMYFVIATVSGLLISRIRMQQLILNQREKRTNALYNLTRDLFAAKSLDDVTECSIKQLNETFHVDVLFIYVESENRLSKTIHSKSTISIDDSEWNIAQLAFLCSQRAGRFTDNIPTISELTYLPLFTKERKFGVVGLLFPDNSIIDQETDTLIIAFISQIGVAVEREYLKEQTKKNLLIAESEKLYKTLFDSVSHELKTPITTILGAVSSFRDDKIFNNKSVFYQLIDETNIAAERLKRLVENLLDITRLESGTLELKKEWHSISDLINSAVQRIRIENAEHKINYQIDENIGLGNFDYLLLEQSLVNIIHNSIDYTPSNSTIEIIAENKDDKIVITISDDGAGFPDGELKNIFKKFYRLPGTKAGGTGLGLSIAKGFIEAHGGTITAGNKKTGGAEIIISLPKN
jgi:two-component system sensor histidine kinase KdpD